MNLKNLKKLLIGAIIALSVAALMAPPVYAGHRSTNLTVSARVLPFIEKDILYQTGVVKVTERDIKRGYVEVSSATVIRVRTNALGGYLLSFGYTGGPFREIWVIEGRRIVVLSDMGGLIHHPGAGPGVETRRLSYRFMLSDNARPGTYAWPLRVDIAVN